MVNEDNQLTNYFDEILEASYCARYRLKITVSNNIRGLSLFYTQWVYFDIDRKVLEMVKNKINDIDGMYVDLQMQRVKRSEVVEILGEVEIVGEEQ